jgi:glyoxylase I family protein
MSITGIVPLLYVKDGEASLAFYCDMLGFDVVQRAGGEAGYLFAQLRSGAASLMINSLPDGGATTVLPDDFGCVLYLNAEDVHALCAELRARGVEVADPESQAYGLDQLWLRDPDGYQLCITSPTNQSRRT